MYFCKFTAEGDCTEKAKSKIGKCDGLRDCPIYEPDKDSFKKELPKKLIAESNLDASSPPQ